VSKHRDPGRRCDNNMYTEPLAAGDVRTLPTNLLDALRALRANADMVDALGAPFVDAYVKLKEQEWHEHHAQISPWERAVTLDC
jgi:glutamine synthetase